MLLEALAWILIVLMGVCATLWIVAIVRVVQSQQHLPHVGDALPAAPRDAWPRVSAVLPVHNEQDMLDACLTSVRAQDYPDLQVVVALDRCDDASPEIAARHAAEDPRLIVTPNNTTRPGWRGKCLPMQVGSEHADGEWLLFIDSDTELDPTLVRAAVATAERCGFEMLGVLPDLRCRRLFEHVAQPVASLNMMLLFPPNKVNRPNGSGRPFTLGAFTLLRRDRYDAIGGMAAVRDQFMEDINLARVVSAAGGRVGIASGAGMFRCVMYETFADFKSGWKRIFIGAAHQRVARLRKQGRRLIIVGLGQPLIQAVALLFAIFVAQRDSPVLAAVLAGFVLLVSALQYFVLARVYRAAGASRLATLLFPVGATIVGLIFERGADDLTRGRPFQWGGHDYICEAR